MSRPRAAYLLAYPSGHSISPAMHEAAFRALGLAHRYHALNVPPQELREAVEALRRPDVLGANVTIPHKEAISALLDRLTPAARAIGAVNTIVPTPQGLEGDNTDAEGFLAAMEELGVEPKGAACVVLGAGGAARAVVWALCRAGASVRIHNRSEARAVALVEAMAEHGRVQRVAGRELEEEVRHADVLINTTSVGMVGTAEESAPLPEGWLPDQGAVIDLVYRPAETVLLRRARAAGLIVQNGLPMLVLQGAASFQRWLGRPAPVDVMRSAASDALTRG